MTEEARPNPDELLRRIEHEEQRAKRARLKIFFGFAPGVGKTYRMLGVARELRAEGVDVLVGVVETHGRTETVALSRDLPTLPRRVLHHRGHDLAELDLDGALARRPKVLLVDELAHTNVPGSRHPKRWQDVFELLEAGIDVWTTMNVQHVESLNDVVAQITGVRVRETVPDRVLERADDIEVIDIAPEELLERLAEGKVYLPDQAGRARDHFFRRGNLLALRELALRRAAQRVDEEMRAYRSEHGVAATWPAGERVLVCVGPAPASARVIRAGYRMAAGLRAPWVAVYVESFERPADRARLDAHLQLAESLGATVVRLEGTSVASAILAHAREHNVTRLLIGKPTHSRWRDRLRGSLLDDVVRGSGDIEVHVVSASAHDEPAREVERAPRSERASEASPAGAYVGAAVVVALATLAAAGLERWLSVPDAQALFIAAVMLVAARAGRGPALFAAALGVGAYDFFFVPPEWTFAVADARYFLTFAVLFGVGFLVSELTTRIRRQERAASSRERRTSALYALSRDLGDAPDRAAVGSALARHASQLFGVPTAVLARGASGLEVLAAEPRSFELDAKELGVAKWSVEHAALAGCGTDTLPGARTTSQPLLVGGAAIGVVVLELGERRLDVERRQSLEALAQQAAQALERLRLAHEAENAALRAKSEELRSSLLSAVSHDLRTPLAAITGASTTLLDPRSSLDADVRSGLLRSIASEADRLERLVSNLLDMTRLEAGAVVVHRAWVPVDELVASALERMDTRLGARLVTTNVEDGASLVDVDPVLVEQLLVNLLDNALKHAPDARPIELDVRVTRDALELTCRDHGPGIPPAELDRIFEKFVRVGAERAGSGLGLAICRAICVAHGGSIRARNAEGGGARFEVSLPRGVPPIDTGRSDLQD